MAVTITTQSGEWSRVSEGGDIILLSLASLLSSNTYAGDVLVEGRNVTLRGKLGLVFDEEGREVEKLLQCISTKSGYVKLENVARTCELIHLPNGWELYVLDDISSRGDVHHLVAQGRLISEAASTSKYDVEINSSIIPEPVLSIMNELRSCIHRLNLPQIYLYYLNGLRHSLLLLHGEGLTHWTRWKELGLIRMLDDLLELAHESGDEGLVSWLQQRGDSASDLYYDKNTSKYDMLYPLVNSLHYIMGHGILLDDTLQSCTIHIAHSLRLNHLYRYVLEREDNENNLVALFRGKIQQYTSDRTVRNRYDTQLHHLLDRYSEVLARRVMTLSTESMRQKLMEELLEVCGRDLTRRLITIIREEVGDRDYVDRFLVYSEKYLTD